MKSKTLYLLVLVSFLLFDKSFSQIYSYPNYLACGIANPLKSSDCLDNSLNTGFGCCYVTQISGKPDTCALVAYSARSTVALPAYTGPPYFDCGLSGSFLKSSLALLLLLFIF